MSACDLLLIDGSSYLYRAYHALPPLLNNQGMATGAIFGVINMLRKCLTDMQPAHIAVVFDAKGKTFRDDLFAQYKAHRPSMPEDLQTQIAPLHAVIQAMGIPLLMIDGVEADDVIGTLACQAAAQQRSVIISSGDKDFAQLVNEYIVLNNSMTNTTLDAAGVLTKFGVSPEQIIDYLTLVGDSADNIPGVTGVGPKTAAKWLQAHGSLEHLLSQLPSLTGKVAENLKAASQLDIAKALLTIKCDVELPLNHSQLLRQSPKTSELKKWFTELGFKSWLKEVSGQADLFAPPTDSLIPLDHSTFVLHTVLHEAQLEALMAALHKTALFAFDTETNSLDTLVAKIVGVSIAINTEEAYYIPFLHDYVDAPAQLDPHHVLGLLKPWLENPAITKVLQNAKFDRNVLKKYDIDLKAGVIDTQLQSYVWRSTEKHNMDALAQKYLNTQTITFESIAGKGSKQILFNDIDINIAAPYAAEDALVTLRLYETLQEKLATTPNLQAVLMHIDLPLMPILADLEYRGVLINSQQLHQQSHELEKRLLALEQQAFVLAGQVFNLNSPKQLQEILFGKLQLPCLQKTPTGQASTSEEVLQDLAYEYELPGVILEFRSLAKLKSTYTDRLPEQVSAKTGRVHTSYHQTVVPTGRLSSSNPNLQNIPVRSADGRKIRQAFIAPPGYKILAADYSQIELRIMAHMSQDATLLNAFAHGEDVHRATASEVFNTPLSEVTDLERRNAKAINFGLMYGMSSFGLAKQLSTGREAAQHYIDAYFERYPGVKQYMDSVKAKAHQQGYVETLAGRRLYLPEIHAKQQMRVKAAERAAINAPLQGTAADIIKTAMIHIDQWLQTSQAPIRMIMQVHDELVFEVAEDQIELATQTIRQTMSSAANFATPLVVDIGVGNNWDEAH